MGNIGKHQKIAYVLPATETDDDSVPHEVTPETAPQRQDESPTQEQTQVDA